VFNFALCAIEVQYLSSALLRNETLTSVDLSHNRLTSFSGKIIAKVLERNEHLLTLNLGWNSIRKDGAIALGRSLVSQCIDFAN
jgi:Ran GTPase-activating protein (RanGAP) involved in mRNA processing and transport